MAESCFGGAGQPLTAPNRVLVGEGVLTKGCRKEPKPRQFFLFNDILVYGNIIINKKKYNKQHIIPLDEVKVLEYKKNQFHEKKNDFLWIFSIKISYNKKNYYHFLNSCNLWKMMVNTGMVGWSTLVPRAFLFTLPLLPKNKNGWHILINASVICSTRMAKKLLPNMLPLGFQTLKPQLAWFATNPNLPYWIDG